MKPSKTFKTTLLLLLITFAIATFSFTWLKEILLYSQNIDLKETKHLETDFKFIGGTINISTHKESFAEFKSEYSKPNWKAKVKWDAKNHRLNIHQPEEKNSNVDDKGKNDWRIKIPDHLESSLNINIGGGLGEFDLSNSKVGSIELHAGGGSFNLNLANSAVSNINANVGGGSLTVDLSGKHDKDIKGKIILGAGLL
ncbi:MAG TPA: toast rack family protein, partial [Pedobacter sp.]